MFIALLTALIALPILKMFNGLSDVKILVAACLLGSAMATVYCTASAARSMVSLLSIALLVFPVNFLFLSPIKSLLFTKIPIAVAKKAHGTTNIVMVVFDELPLVSLMDSNHMIDPIRYPNFSQLAASSTWYRNATTVAAGTLRSLPSILTGNLPTEEHRLPTAEIFPQSLFSFLGESHHLNIWESVTSICPSQLCPDRKNSGDSRLISLCVDASIIYLHIIAPEGMTSRLPHINQNWGNFLADGSGGSNNKSVRKVRWLRDIVGPWQINNDEVEVFREFVDSIDDGKIPSLHYIHVLLPHAPFKYLPSGKHYRNSLWATTSETGKNARGTWVHEWAAARHHQQSLLQLGYVDKLLGELVTALKSSGIWDETLLIITSDHGASYRVNDRRRTLSATNYMDILPVIMLIKHPNQEAGKVTDSNVETIDILPTIADILETPLPFEVDGVPMRHSSQDTKPWKRAYLKTSKDIVFYEPTMDEKFEAVDTQTALLGSGDDPIVIYGLDLRRDALGQPANVFKSAFSNGVEIDSPEQFDEIDLSEDFLPVTITGRVQPQPRLKAPFDLAIAVNGVVRAVGKTYLIGHQNEFSIIVPEASFQEGNNTVNAFILNGTGILF
ncbi:MAG: sulfatase-like hydrolase/transferase [Halioglobus sp.]|nr:sulfatase-like hydrolase/transferase [Halioglobus sp.]